LDPLAGDQDLNTWNFEWGKDFIYKQ
jgi:hypothetical protein